MGKRRGHGEGAIYQRESDGKWCANVDLGWVNGKRKRKVVYGETKKEVTEKLKALHRDQASGINIAPEQYTVAQFLTRWLDEVICNREPRTQESYRATVKKHMVPYVGHHMLQKLLPEHVQAMANALRLREPAPKERALGPRSAAYACLVLSRALNQAKRWDYVSRNVVDAVDLPKVRQLKVHPATEDQARALLDAVHGHRLETIYWVALMLGLRRGEILGLRINDIDFDAMAIQAILGHANITTTLNVYGHLLPNVLREATNRIGGLAGERPDDPQ